MNAKVLLMGGFCCDLYLKMFNSTTDFDYSFFFGINLEKIDNFFLDYILILT